LDSSKSHHTHCPLCSLHRAKPLSWLSLAVFIPARVIRVVRVSEFNASPVLILPQLIAVFLHLDGVGKVLLVHHDIALAIKLLTELVFLGYVALNGVFMVCYFSIL
jgi:hypothetical protein